MMRQHLAISLVFAMAITTMANSDEIARTTDGRTILLRSDGTYSEIGGIAASILAEAVATATTYAIDKMTILMCLDKEPDGLEKMQLYFDDDEEKTRLSWLASGGSAAEWGKIEGAIRKSVGGSAADCSAVLDGWARLERFSWPLSQRSPFNDMSR